MDFDELQRTWQSQGSGPQLAIDPDMLLKEIRRNKRSLEATVFWRDVREVGAAIFVAIASIFLGIIGHEWPWFLLGLSVLWIAGFMAVDRIRQKRKTPVPREPLMACIQSSLVQVNHQIWLLKNVLWWYVLPPGIGYAVVLCHFAWQLRHVRWVSLTFLALVGLSFVAWWGIYWLNQRCVRKELIPRQQELEALLNSLKPSQN